MSVPDAKEFDTLLDTAVGHLQRGDAPAAENLLRQALNISPDDPEATTLLGVVQQQQGRSDQARATFERSLELDPQFSDAHYNLGELLLQASESQAALEHFEACVGADPTSGLAWLRIGQLRGEQDDDESALAAMERAAALLPPDGLLLLALGRQQMKLKQWPAAEQTLSRAAQLIPDHLQVFVMLYRTASVLGHAEKSLAASDRALDIAPTQQKVLKDRIDLLIQFNLQDQAIEAARNYVLSFGDDPEGHRRLAAIFMGLREYGAAARAAAKVIELLPEDASAYSMLAAILISMGRSRDAISHIEHALELDPQAATSRLNYSVALEKINRRDDAIQQAQMVLEADPNNQEVLGWLGQLMAQTGRLPEALKHFNRLLKLAPTNPVALGGVAMLAIARARPRLAWELYETAFAALSDDAMAVSTALLAAIANPSLSPQRIFELHREWARRTHLHLPHAPFTQWSNDPDPDRRLRIGYVSADFRAHSVAYFLEPLVAAHNRNQVELIAFDNTPTPDNITAHLRTQFDEWHRIVGVDDPRVAEIIRQRRIDILVDLGGHTSDTRLPLFALKPAPVQVTYLGYPETTGLLEMDYRLTDAIADPPGQADELATEKLFRLPRGFLCFNPPKPYADVSPLPAGEAGPITFGAFNAVRKINDEVIALWCRVLRAVPGSTLLFKANGLDDDETQQVLRESFLANGMSDDRVRFLPRTKRYSDHLAVYSQIDIALDTFPYNGTTTTCEGLWMGVPVITTIGDRHAARVSLSILTQVGLPELAAPTSDEYVHIATQLAADRPRLAALRASLRERLANSSLMDGPAHAAAIEEAYRTMWKTWCASAPSRRPPSKEELEGKRAILVEGWRWLPHSYAVVNQWQCLQLLRRQEIALFHKDLPFYNSTWRTRRGIFSAPQEIALERIRSLPPEFSPDVAYRIAYRIDITPHPSAKQTIVFGTAEFPGRPLEILDHGRVVSRINLSPEVLLVTPSQWSKLGFVRAGADPQRVRVIPHGVDIATYRPLEPPERAKARNAFGFNSFTFLNVGAMTANKGGDRLLQGFARVCQQNPDVLLLFKGVDSLYRSGELLEYNLSQLPHDQARLVRSRVRYLGGVLPMAEMARLYAAADAYVSPYVAEGFNLPVLEAAACGLPIICSAGGPTDEHTTPDFALSIQTRRITVAGEDGEYEELDPDADHLVALMQQVVEDHPFRSQARLSGPAHVSQHFTWAHVVDQLLTVFAEQR